MKSFYDFIQAVLLVVIVGAMFVAIPLIGLFLAVIATIAFVYLAIKEDREHPSE